MNIFDEYVESTKGELEISDNKWGHGQMLEEWEHITNWIQSREEYAYQTVQKEFGLPEGVEVKINRDVNYDDVEIGKLTYNGVKLHNIRFKGIDYVGRTIQIYSPKASGWSVKLGENKPYQVNGNTLEHWISTTDPISINIILEDNGVHETIYDDHLIFDTVTGLIRSLGTISVWDLNGRLLIQGENQIKLPHKGCFIVNGHSLVWNNN